MKTINLISGLVLAVSLTACGGKGTAKLQFSSGARAPMVKLTADEAQALGMAAATGFQMKLIAAYLAEDIDSNQNNVGNTSMFWLNTECGNDIMHCDVDSTVHGGLAEDGTPWTHTVSTFFDFSNVTNVNATLNSQGGEIDTGTYKYVRLEFCKYSPTSANIKWTYNSSTNQFAQASCTVTRQIDPPIEVKAGDAVTITLAYDLSNSVSTGGGGGAGSNCDGSGNCFVLPTFTPSASK